MPKLLKVRTPKQAYQHAWYIKNRARLKILNAKWQNANQARIKRNKLIWRKNNPDKLRAQRLRYWHGMSLADYRVLFNAQNGVCAVCAKPPDEKWFCVDHCHRTGKIRGLLHRRCNILVGQLDKHPGPLAKIFAYLRKGGHPGRKNITVKSRAHEKRKNWIKRTTFGTRKGNK